MGDDEPIVRHAEHFLSRLDRLGTQQVDLALGLYRHPELVRSVLQQISLPESAERVALSLGDPVRGPFIVVTRDGHFVTCLSEGMTVGDLPVVTYGQLGALAEKFVELRVRMVEAARLTGGSKRACSKLLRRILTRPDAVSREEFLAVSAWEPLLSPVFLDLYLSMAGDLPTLAVPLLRLKSKKGRAAEALHGYWNLVHATGHLALLATMGGEQEHHREIIATAPDAGVVFASPLTQVGVTRFIVRGAWAAGRIGKLLLPAYKKALTDGASFYDLLDAIFALIAIGRRTSRLRGEIAKALHAVPASARTADAARFRAAARSGLEAMCEIAATVLETDEPALDEWVVASGAGLLGLDETKASQIPRHVAGTLLHSVYLDGVTQPKNAARCFTMIAAAVRGPPEQFYYPQAALQRVYKPWTPEETELLLAPQRAVLKGANQPAKREERPGPNQPCSCGSEKKYKKCCGSPERRAGSR